MAFQKAVKFQAKARVALVGPPGSGKTKTGLILATALGGKIAGLDTEHGSMAKFADEFDFDVETADTFEPKVFLGALRTAEADGYSVFLCDSLSHFWMGTGGALEFIDNNKAASRDQMDPWKKWRPMEREMFEAIIASPIHVLCTMRTKNEYAEEIGNDGKKKRKKIGLAPVQREGLEYEFDLVGYMDPEQNTFVTDKSRCPGMNGKSIIKPKAKDFAPYIDWLAGAEPPPKAPSLREQALAVLVPAASQGTPALEMAWKMMSNDMRRTVVDEMPKLKEQATHAVHPA